MPEFQIRGWRPDWRCNLLGLHRWRDATSSTGRPVRQCMRCYLNDWLDTTTKEQS